MRRYGLRDEQWKRIKDILPTRKGHGVPYQQEPSPETKLCGLAGISDGLSGNDGAVYHRRSRVETKMHCIKLLRQCLSARNFDRQIAAVHVRIAVLNRFTAQGTPLTHPVT